jgi:hypothetical protein
MCTIGDDGVYTVKNGYCFLASNFLPEVVWRGVDGSIVKKVWDSFAPTKVVIFSWQLLLQKLPTRYNLARRGVLLSPAQRLRGAFGKLGIRSFLKERKWRPLKLWTQLNISRFRARKHASVCLQYEWDKHPLICLRR